MYLKHFGFNEFPFSLTPNLRFFCNLTSYKEALNVIMVSLHNNEGFVKITGDVGTGKTLLCRKLLNSLSDEYVTAYVANGSLDSFTLQKTVAHELGILFPENVDNHKLLNLLTEKLIELHRNNKHVVAIIDEAHALSDQTLESLRFLTNLETESSKLLQIVLVGQTELDQRLNKKHLRPLKHRIIFSYSLPTLCNKKELLSYLSCRLVSAGYNNTYDSLFSPKAINLLLKASRGIPRLINVICHKALLITYGYDEKKISTATIKIAIADTESVATTTATLTNIFKIAVTSLLLTTTIGIGIYFILKLPLA